jgi:threonyl-tRNA synthetase
VQYARAVHDRLKAVGVRASVEARSDTIGYKIRAGVMDKVPYLLIVGDREVQNDAVSVRTHERGDEGAVAVEEFGRRITGEIESKKL